MVVSLLSLIVPFVSYFALFCYADRLFHLRISTQSLNSLNFMLMFFEAVMNSSLIPVFIEQILFVLKPVFIQ